MTQDQSLKALRELIRQNYLTAESTLAPALIKTADLDPQIRKAAQQEAANFVKMARASAERSGLIDKFLQEYGLSTAEGVTLMRLAEALLRTPDAATANALIEDKIEAGDWSAHKGKSPFPLVNFSTRALMLTAAWLDDEEAKDPLRRMAAATKAAFDRLGEPVIRASVAQAMRVMGEHFVLGETIHEAMKRGRKYSDKGYLFSFDMLGEAAHTAEDAQNYFRDYQDAIAAIAAHANSENAADNPGISVKLSALHPRYEYEKKARVLDELGSRLRQLAVQAKSSNLSFNIDAEECDRLDLSLDLIEMMMRDPALDGWRGFGVVVQAYQRRAPFVLDWLAALARDTGRRMMVRLVKGAYWDGEIKRAQILGLESYPVFTRKVLTDLSYLACARKLFASTDVFYPQFATHNALTATTVREMAGNYENYELQRLHGMGEALHDNLIAHGARSRIYAPVGGHKELLPYLVRRLLENGANSSFVNQLIDPDLSVDDVVADPIDELATVDQFSNPNIPAPRDHLEGERLAAKGWDTTHPPTAARLSAAVSNAPMQQEEDQESPRLRVVNPITGAVTFYAAADNTAIELACAEAATAQPAWAARSDRAQILRRAADALEERAEEFMRIAVHEAGKTIPDAIAEVREAVDFLRYYADQSEALTGAPLGVIACISPWNFPLAIFLGQVSAALAAGNTVIAKPAEQTPAMAIAAVQLMHQAGAPPEALQLLIGDGPSVGAPLISRPEINGVVFTGSVEVAQTINRTLCKSEKADIALIAETGGINAMIVDSTALLEQAVMDTIASAFQSAGQRCSACRVVCVQEDIADRFKEMLAGAMDELSVGDPALLATDIGPVIDEDAFTTITDYIRKLENIAERIAAAQEAPAALGGFFASPVAYELDKLSDLKREIFGPVLHLVTFKANELIDLVGAINAMGFGLTMGVHTRIDETMHEISSRARIGNVYVNRNQIGAVVGVQPFGGEGLSGTGPKAGGPHYLQALQKRRLPAGGAPISIAQTGGAITETAASAHNAYDAWRLYPDRGEVFERAIKLADTKSASILSEALNIYRQHFADIVSLPGPTGESNTLRLRPRGVLYCLGGGDDDANERQFALALAAGNGVLSSLPAANVVDQAIHNAGGPSGLVQRLSHLDVASEELLRHVHVTAVAFDGDQNARLQILRHLAARDGALTPLLSSLDAPWRYAVERTLTINTTAAGGDVRLLSIGN